MSFSYCPCSQTACLCNHFRILSVPSSFSHTLRLSFFFHIRHVANHSPHPRLIRRISQSRLGAHAHMHSLTNANTVHRISSRSTRPAPCGTSCRRRVSKSTARRATRTSSPSAPHSTPRRAPSMWPMRAPRHVLSDEQAILGHFKLREYFQSITL